MPFPVDYTLIPVHGQWWLDSGAVASGSVTFVSSIGRVVDIASGDVIMPGNLTVGLDVAGAFTINLPSTDDPSIAGTPFYYVVTVDIRGQDEYTGTLIVPYTTAGTLELGSALGAGTPPPDPDTPFVQSINGKTGALSTADIGGVPSTRAITAGSGLTGGGDLSADRTIAANFGSSAGTITQGNDSRLSDSRTPSGSATGDLSGTYPAPSVAKVHGVAVSGTPATGNVLTATGSTAATWQVPASALSAWQFSVEAYGAVGDGTTDDTAAIISAVNAAVTYAQANHGYAEVIFKPVTYLIAANPTTGGSTNGSAQIPLPNIAMTAQKVVLVLKGTREQSALYSWLQTSVQRAGTVLKSTYNAGNSLPATGEVSVVGGPTPHYFTDPSTQWSNMLVVVDGIGVEVPVNPNICGFDFRCVAELSVISAACLTASTSGAPPIPPANWSFGLACPVANNNALVDIKSFSCEGQVYGLIAYEHAQISAVRIINCYDGLTFWSATGFPHANVVSYACVEGCTQSLVFAGALNKVEIACLDVEWGSGHMIRDVGVSGSSTGTIAIGSNGGSGASLNAALSDPTTGYSSNTTMGLRVINRDQATGYVGDSGNPAVPLSTVVFRNPYWRDAMVTISGGSGVGVDVDGTGINISPSVVMVGTGKTIKLTYTGAPTWKWWLL